MGDTDVLPSPSILHLFYSQSTTRGASLSPPSTAEQHDPAPSAAIQGDAYGIGGWLDDAAPTKSTPHSHDAGHPC